MIGELYAIEADIRQTGTQRPGRLHLRKDACWRVAHDVDDLRRSRICQAKASNSVKSARSRTLRKPAEALASYLTMVNSKFLRSFEIPS